MVENGPRMHYISIHLCGGSAKGDELGHKEGFHIKIEISMNLEALKLGEADDGIS